MVTPIDHRAGTLIRLATEVAAAFAVGIAAATVPVEMTEAPKSEAHVCI